MATQLVGRAAELARLDDGLDDLWAGGSPAVVVTGEPGIGKSRLLAELTDRARARGGLVLAGRAAEYETDLPFAPWVDALDAYVADHPPADGAALAGVLPALERDAPPVGVERHRVHAAMRSLLAALASDAPLVVILDDLHWADPSSIDLIAALLRRPPAAAVLLALAFRHRQASPRLEAAVDRAEREGRTLSVRLAPLDAETAGLLLGPDLPVATRELLFLESGGNPFYLEHLARSAGAAPADGSAALPGVPRAVSAALAEELRRVEGDTRTVLDAAAVIGVDFDPETVAAVAVVAPEVAIDALDALVGVDLVRPSIHPRRFTIRHPLVRRAIYDTTGAGWRLLAHERAAASLRARGAAPETLAHHVAVSARRRRRGGDRHPARRGDRGAARRAGVGGPLDRRRARADAAEPAGAGSSGASASPRPRPPRARSSTRATTLLGALDALPATRRRARPADRPVPSAWTGCSGIHGDGHERLDRHARGAAATKPPTSRRCSTSRSRSTRSTARELADMVSWGERAIAADGRAWCSVRRARRRRVRRRADRRHDARASAVRRSRRAVRDAQRRGARRPASRPRSSSACSRCTSSASPRRPTHAQRAASTRRARPATPTWSRCSRSRWATRPRCWAGSTRRRRSSRARSSRSAWSTAASPSSGCC